MDHNEIKYFIEAGLLAAGRPLSVDQLHGLFDEGAAPDKAEIRQAIKDLVDDYEDRGLTISEVASGFRIQVKAAMADRLQKLWEERPPRYSRALFETLALVAYRQPITRGEIEEIRGVSVSTNIIRSLLEREWVRVVGHRDVPGRPAMFGTTRQFLDYFGLKKLDDLPPLADLSDWESLRVQLNLPAVEEDEEDLGVESAEITDLPVLYPEGRVGKASGDVGSAELEESAFEEIVASEWPDPHEIPVAIADDEADDEAGDESGEDPAEVEDRDASASGR